MEQRLDLGSAGKILGLTASAMRARAKKDPAKYRLEADNSGKLWVWIDPEKEPSKPHGLKAPNTDPLNPEILRLKASIEALKPQLDKALEAERLSARADVLAEQVRGLEMLVEEMRAATAASERRANAAEADRDRWHALAIRPWWKRLAG